MAKLTGPLFSLAASGTIADTLTFAKWKGIDYVRTRVIPANPQSADQTEVRNSFRTLNEMWKRMNGDARASFIEAVNNLPLTARNRHIQANLKLFRDAGDMEDYVFSVSSGQGLPPASVTINGAATLINIIALLPGTPPVGHSFSKRFAACIPHGDPNDGLTPTERCVTSIHPSSNFTIPNLDSGDYTVGCWIEWERDSDGHLFYGTFLGAPLITVP